MGELINKLMHMGVRGFIDESRQKLAMEDERYLQDAADEYDPEQRYGELDLSRKQRVLIDDYIGCVKTVGDRYSNISYIAGFKDAVVIFAQLGLLK